MPLATPGIQKSLVHKESRQNNLVTDRNWYLAKLNWWMKIHFTPYALGLFCTPHVYSMFTCIPKQLPASYN